MTDPRVEQWRKNGDYLPDFMRDFHDQKDLFKSIHEIISVDKHDYAKGIDWVSGQCYVIDIFLWHLARHGYTLQKNRARLPFDDIVETTSRAKERRTARIVATSPVLQRLKASQRETERPMATVWKYTLPIADEFTIKMPRAAELLFVAAQNDHPCLWARVVPERDLTDRKFRLCGTGHPIDMDCEHVGSFMMRDGALVFHLFEIDPPAHRDA